MISSLRTAGLAFVFSSVMGFDPLAHGSDLARRPGAIDETYPEHRVVYDSVRGQSGDRYRIIVVRPESSGRVATIFLTGWLSCNSVESPPSAEDSISLIFKRIARLPNFAFVRLDKPGSGDSEGDCSKTDFNAELAAYRAAFARMRTYDFVDQSKIFIIGSSNGAGWAPLVSGDVPIAGYLVFGAWEKTWYEHMMEIERRRFALLGKPAGEVNDLMRLVARFYTEYLIDGQAPRAIIGREPQMRTIWPGEDDLEHLYDRPVSYYQQLQALNLAQAWSRVGVPTLVLRGEFDWIMSRDDSETIVRLVNQRSPGLARFEELPHAGHALDRHQTLQAAFGSMALPFDTKTADKIAEWFEDQLHQARTFQPRENG
jgi:pimeloyl-ACP methyl ester carboxylesterase